MLTKMLFTLALGLGAVAPLLAQTSAATQAPVIPLYTGSIPDSKPSPVRETSTPQGTDILISGVVQPSLTAFLPLRDKATGTAVIICPGGGYGVLSINKEGYDVARRLADLGVAAFVLKYRLPSDQAQPDKSIAPLLDVQQALRVVRGLAAKYSLNPERIGVMGFSAGGHLAAMAGTQFAAPVGDNPAPGSVRPAFLALIYPVISFQDSLQHAGSRTNLLGAAPDAAQVRHYSNELNVSAQTPPAFLVHAQDDNVVPVQNSLVFYQALTRHQVPAELHLYAKGGHGFGLNNATTKDQWFDRLREWLDANGWLAK